MLHPQADDVHTAPATAAQDSSSSSSQGSVRPHVTKAAQAGVGGQVQGGQVQGGKPAPGPGPASASAAGYEAGPLGPSLSSPLPSAANGHSLMSGGGSYRDQGMPAKPPQSAGAAGAGAGGIGAAVLPSPKGSGQLPGSFQAAPGGSQPPARAGSAPVPDAPAAHLPSAPSIPANGVLGGRGSASIPAVSATGASAAAATTAGTPFVGSAAVDGAGAGAAAGGAGSNRQVPGMSAVGAPARHGVQATTGGLPGIGLGWSVAHQPAPGVRETGELLQVLNAPQALEVGVVSGV